MYFTIRKPCLYKRRKELHSFDKSSPGHIKEKAGKMVGGFNPLAKYYIVKLDHLPVRVISDNKKCLKPPPRPGLCAESWLSTTDRTS